MITQFPSEILSCIFSYTDLPTITNCSRVCKLFKQAAENNNLWRDLFKRDFKITFTSKEKEFNSLTSYKKLYEFEKCSSNFFKINTYTEITKYTGLISIFSKYIFIRSFASDFNQLDLSVFSNEKKPKKILNFETGFKSIIQISNDIIFEMDDPKKAKRLNFYKINKVSCKSDSFISFPDYSMEIENDSFENMQISENCLLLTGANNNYLYNIKDLSNYFKTDSKPKNAPKLTFSFSKIQKYSIQQFFSHFLIVSDDKSTKAFEILEDEKTTPYLSNQAITLLEDFKDLKIYSHDEFLVLGHTNGKITVLDSQLKKLITDYPLIDAPITSITIKNTFLLCKGENTLKIFDIKAGIEIQEIRGLFNFVSFIDHCRLCLIEVQSKKSLLKIHDLNQNKIVFKCAIEGETLNDVKSIHFEHGILRIRKLFFKVRRNNSIDIKLSPPQLLKRGAQRLSNFFSNS